jgi:hypothetical protein
MRAICHSEQGVSPCSDPLRLGYLSGKAIGIALKAVADAAV